MPLLKACQGQYNPVLESFRQIQKLSATADKKISIQYRIKGKV
jgi:hypothetical protein